MTREMTYRSCAIAGASPVDLMIVLFDRLVADLRRAAEAIRVGDIETRCDEINHALLVLGQLESWLDREKGGEPARLLASFYARLRAGMMQGSVTLSPALLEEQIEALIHIRSSWQQLVPMPAQPMMQPHAIGSPYPKDSFAPAAEYVRFSQSA